MIPDSVVDSKGGLVLWCHCKKASQVMIQKASLALSPRSAPCLGVLHTVIVVRTAVVAVKHHLTLPQLILSPCLFWQLDARALHYGRRISMAAAIFPSSNFMEIGKETLSSMEESCWLTTFIYCSWNSCCNFLSSISFDSKQGQSKLVNASGACEDSFQIGHFTFVHVSALMLKVIG